MCATVPFFMAKESFLDSQQNDMKPWNKRTCAFVINYHFFLGFLIRDLFYVVRISKKEWFWLIFAISDVTLNYKSFLQTNVEFVTKTNKTVALCYLASWVELNWIYFVEMQFIHSVAKSALNVEHRETWCAMINHLQLIRYLIYIDYNYVNKIKCNWYFIVLE